MESIKEKINKYINDRGLLKTPAHYVKELFNDIVNKVSITENIISFDTNELNIDTKNGYYYNENLIDSIKITMIDDIIQPRVEFNGLSPKIELPKNIIVNNKLINYNGIGKYVLSFNNNTCDIERYKYDCDFTKAPSGYVIVTYDSDMLGDGYLSYNGKYTFTSLDRDYTTNYGPVLNNEKFITYVGNSIESSLFNGCPLKSIEIPDSVTSIGNDAFSYCSGLTSVVIGNSLTTIGDYAFNYCYGLTSITIPNSVTKIGQYAFSICAGLTSVELGNSVKSIGGYAFYQCTGLTSITIPDSVTSIGNNAFNDCSNITSVELGNSVNSIGSYAFRGCYYLTSIEIPNSVTSIGSYAFRYCYSLAQVTLYSTTPPTLGNSSVFNSTSSDLQIYVPDESVDTYKTATNWSSYADKIKPISEKNSEPETEPEV